jgi:secreted PhoX family phosphatase
MRRRELVLGGVMALGGGSALAQSVLGGETYTPTAPATAIPGAPPPPNPQAAKLDDTIGAGFSRIVIASWGDLIIPDAPAFDPAHLTPAQADAEFPYDGVIAGLMAPPVAQDGIARLVMVVATPDVPARMVFAPGQDSPTVAGRMQGVTVFNLQYLGGRWVTVDGGYQTRRISDSTLCSLSGPAAAAVGDTVQGVLAPACGRATPWGSVLLAEGDAAPWLSRLANVGYGYGDPAQAARFGWIVELNPLDPNSIPVKRTALGRMPRGGIAVTQTKDGRPVVFFTQDAPSGALFRFIAATNATDGTALDSGTLAVAQLSGNNIQWADLGTDNPTLVGLAGAAQAAGAEMFDAPGGLALSADGATLYMACAGNAARTDTDALNPRAGDDNGHVIAFALPGSDATAKTFGATLALIAGNPDTAMSTQYPPGSTAWLRKPRTLGLDASGQLWIGTDQNGDTSQTADGLFILPSNGGSLSIAYLAPIGAAIGGAVFDAGTKTAFGMVRHPGATPTASYNFPATRWPTLQPGMPPQSTIVGLVTP